MTFVKVVIGLTIALLVMPHASIGQSDCGLVLDFFKATNDPVMNAKIARACAPEAVERSSQRLLMNQYCLAETFSRTSQVIATPLRDYPELKDELAYRVNQATVCHQTAIKALTLLHLNAEPKWTNDFDDCLAAVLKARAVAQHPK